MFRKRFWQPKGTSMRRSLRPSRWLAAILAAGCAVPALLLTGAAPAAVYTGSSAGTVTAAHRCLVMTGSGDPAFTRNFNPYPATGLPSGSFVQGAFYEPLIVTPEGGLKPVPWLARSWKWSRGNKTLTLNIARGAKWSDGKPLTASDVVYSLTAGRQDKIMDRVGLTGAANNIASVRAKGAARVVINLKTPDSQFISSTLNRQFVVPRHIWSKVKDPSNYTNSHPVGSGPFDRITRFTTQDYVFGKNPSYWRKGQPKVACLEYVQAASNDAALALIQSGQVATPTGNWEHFAHPGATKLLNKWKVTLNVSKQRTIATQLERIFLQQLPIVPLFIGPRWSTYSTRYFHCFNSPKNFYGDPIFTTFPDNVLSFTRICPGGK